MLNRNKLYFVSELLDTIQAPKGFNYVFMSRFGLYSISFMLI